MNHQIIIAAAQQQVIGKGGVDGVNELCGPSRAWSFANEHGERRECPESDQPEVHDGRPHPEEVSQGFLAYVAGRSAHLTSDENYPCQLVLVGRNHGPTASRKISPRQAGHDR